MLKIFYGNKNVGNQLITLKQKNKEILKMSTISNALSRYQ